MAGDIRRELINTKENVMELTKEALEELIEEKAKVATEAHGKEYDDHVAGIVKEAMEDSLKDYDKKRLTFEEAAGEREDPKGGFKSMAQFAKGVYDARSGFSALNSPAPSHELKLLNEWLGKAKEIQGKMEKAAGSPAQGADSLQAGGALIPPEFSRTALDRARTRSNILANAMTIPMATNTINIPFIDGFNESTGLVAGNVKFRTTAERAELTGNRVNMSMVTLTLRKSTALIFVDEEMMDLSPISIQPFLTTALDNALDLHISDQLVNGTGAGEAMGILNAPCFVSVPKESGQANTTLVYENTLNMFARSTGRGNWYGSRSIIPQLGVMNVSVGTGGSAVFIANNGGIQSATATFPGSLHGSGLDYLDVMPTLGTVGDLVLADWSQYLVGQRSGGNSLEMSESMHLKFDFDQRAFKARFYMDGQPWWPEAFQPKNGDSRSPFVGTASRP